MELVVFRTNKKYNTEIKLSQDGIKNVVDNKTKIRMIHELFFMIFGILVNLIQIGVIVYALIAKDVSVGGVVAIITLLPKAYEPISIFNVEYIDYKLNKVAVNRFKEFLSLPDSKNLLDNGEKITSLEGNLELVNVSFSYDNKQVLKNISLKINKSEKVAFVGESGSGKSTIIKLIAGLISTNNGIIKIDNNNINDVNLNSYYDYLSYLSQESPIFDGTLRENILIDKQASDDEIIKVLKLVCLNDFLQKLPKGLDTPMGEKGVLVSGGERQRIALARLFFDNSRVVILDEATSAMDNITEQKVMEIIYEKLNDKTIIIIAHRLSTIKNVDNIFVLKSGEIVGYGKFDTLLKESEYFSQLNLKNKKEQ
jgi:ATP-binding cassette subfamily B protein